MRYLPLFIAVLLAGCGPDLPDGITTDESTALGYPDTVEVMVQGQVDRSDASNMQMGRPGPVQRAWLDKHSYVQVGYEYDSTATAELDPPQSPGTVTGYFLLQYERVE